jgi:hypothetical protein
MSAAVLASDQNWEDKPVDVLTRSWRKLLDNSFNSELDFAETGKWETLQRVPPSRWKQPVVAVECVNNYTAKDTVTFVFTSIITEGKVSLDTKSNRDFDAFYESVWREKGGFPAVRSQFLDLPDNHTSAAILFLTDVTLIDANNWLFKGFNELYTEFPLCRIHSRWVEASVWSEPGESVYKTHLDASLFDIEAHFGPSTRPEDLIRTSKGWLNATSRQCDPVPEKPSSSPANSSYQDFMNFCHGYNSTAGASNCSSVSIYLLGSIHDVPFIRLNVSEHLR